jgi:hypothetical protein
MPLAGPCRGPNTARFILLGCQRLRRPSRSAGRRSHPKDAKLDLPPRTRLFSHQRRHDLGIDVRDMAADLWP